MFDLSKNSGLYEVKLNDDETLFLKAPTRNIEIRILELYDINDKDMSMKEQEMFLHELGCDILIGRLDHIEHKKSNKGIKNLFKRTKRTIIDKSFVESLPIEALATLIMDYMETFYKFNKKK